MDTQILLAILADQKEELERKDFSRYCTRREEKQLKLECSLAQVVIGVRRSGKSTLCEMFLSKSGLNFAYVNFDDDRLDGLETSDLDKVLEALYIIYGDFKYLFLDEIQNIRNWQLFVNRLLRQGIYLFITGSNAKLLSNELASHLTGRHYKIELYPYSFSEYCLMRGTDTISLSVKSSALRKAALGEYLSTGGFPELQHIEDRRTYVESLLESIIRNDIAKRFRIRNIEVLRRLARHLIDNFSQEFVAANLSKQFGIGEHTVENYYSYLKEAFLLIGINKFSWKSVERVRNEKAYLVDTAFFTDKDNSFSMQNLGWKLENAVCIELMRRYRPLFRDIYYYKERDWQVDFIVAKAGTPEEAIQVSYDISSEKTFNREIRSLVKAAEKLKCKRLTLITFGDRRKMEVSGHEIDIVPAADWLCGTNTPLSDL